MADDWQDHALSTRHMHNRNSRRDSKDKKKTANFDVRKTFGDYEVKCTAYDRVLKGSLEGDDQDDLDEPQLELLRLTDDGQGILGLLKLPGVVAATVVLAASRKRLQIITDRLSGDVDGDQDDDEDEDANSDDHDEDDDDDDDASPDRFDTFEKNSFRSPKFWLAWNGVVDPKAKENAPPSSPVATRKLSNAFSFKSNAYQEGLGYVVFTTNDCRKFKGTLSCKELGWKDVSLNGFKSTGKSESDRPVVWAGKDVDVDAGARGKGGVQMPGPEGRVDPTTRRVIFD
ncbi:hypothetical protein MCOR25_001935 [Pyricularia grisea]|uniref:Uncharacterized protein n=1 Tax=Pyricularia grisea TaxID=148305 RepID=A0A6P8BGV2_PYRGI|nr:uncharacterized protein PgNI_01926 [Pyricularia grisea]KAI6379802.1 hypothetical protein MCOR25_001935 [Pyricularia grisea]TLD16096.1 hypothetical protein PgNI_01926 [Pyricularia grisea]